MDYHLTEVPLSNNGSVAVSVGWVNNAFAGQGELRQRILERIWANETVRSRVQRKAKYLVIA